MRALLLSLLLAAPVSAQVAVSTPPALRLLSENELPDFTESFPTRSGLIKAAKKTLEYLKTSQSLPKSFKLGDRDYAPGILTASVEELIRISSRAATPEVFAAEIRKNFDVFQSVGSDGQGRVVFSSYYQPMLQASRKKTKEYAVPLYGRPADMVYVDLDAFGKKNGADVLVGRLDAKTKRIVPYFSRSDIDVKKKLAGKGLEVAWLKDKFQALDLHIQGSGILKFPDGKEVLAKYAATNGLNYNSVGLTLVNAKIIPKEEITREKLKDYLRTHPEAEDWLLAQNPRFTFFELAALPPDGEPFGSIQQSLTPSRSIAIDPLLAPLGSIAYFTVPAPQADKAGNLLGVFPSSRFAMAMDTGGAIKGPGRVDIYVGHGKQAEVMAPAQWHEGKLYFLVKKLPPRDR